MSNGIGNMDRDPPEDFLHHYGQSSDDLPGGLFEAALALAALDHPDRSRAFYRDVLRRMENDLRPLSAGPITAADRASLLADCLSARHGFSGDRRTYDDLENANLMSVIDRRRGLPISLGILYIHLARALGWAAHGLNFPAHFLIRIDGLADRAILDPFNDGTILTPAGMRQLLKSVTGDSAELRPQHYAPMNDRALLLRLQNNIKMRRVSSGDFPGAIAVLRRMLLIAPLKPDLWYDVAILELHRGQHRAGRDALEKCLTILDMRLPSDRRNIELRSRVLKSLRELAPLIE